jgi:hypothetical protein
MSDERIQLYDLLLGFDENLGTTSEGGEMDIDVKILNPSLASQAIVAAQKRLRLAAGTQRLHALLDLHNALMTDSSAPTRRRHLDLEVVCVIEDGLTADEVTFLVFVLNSCHRNSKAMAKGSMAEPTESC